MDELWNAFIKSGSVEDYLQYTAEQKTEVENADDGKRLDNKGTDNRGE